VLAGALTVGCGGAHRPLETTVWHGEDPSAVVVLLPGIFANDRSFAVHGIVQSARSAGVKADLVGVRTTLGHYAAGTLAERLEADVLPAIREHYDHVSLLGVSLGGLGAIAAVAADPESFDEVVLLSPFLGRRTTVADVRRAGGLQQWDVPADPSWEQRVWANLKPWTSGRPMPPIWLGYGERDRFVGTPVPLAEILPADHVRVVDGGHDWRTWRTMVRDLVEAGALRVGGDRSAS
jgi:enterochelin esterase-like enzyme